MRMVSGIVIALVIAAPVSADSFPARRSGLWEITMQSSSGAPTQTMKQCVDQKSDERMMQMSSGLASQMGAVCNKNEVRKVGPNYITESECQMMGVTIISRGTVSGDFTTSYSGTTEVRYSPALMGMTQSTSSIAARWLGECTADQKPGDIIMANGMKMSVDMLEQAGKGALPPKGR